MPVLLAAYLAIAGGQQVGPGDLDPKELPSPRIVPARCGTAETGEILVCGRRNRSVRLKPLPDIELPDEKVMVGVALPGGARIEPVVSQSSNGAGAHSGIADRRVTVRLKVPF